MSLIRSEVEIHRCWTSLSIRQFHFIGLHTLLKSEIISVFVGVMNSSIALHMQKLKVPYETFNFSTAINIPEMSYVTKLC